MRIMDCHPMVLRQNPKKVLILMSHTGGGHRAFAEAIKAALSEDFGDEYQFGAFKISKEGYVLLRFAPAVDDLRKWLLTEFASSFYRVSGIYTKLRLQALRKNTLKIKEEEKQNN